MSSTSISPEQSLLLGLKQLHRLYPNNSFDELKTTREWRQGVGRLDMAAMSLDKIFPDRTSLYAVTSESAGKVFRHREQANLGLTRRREEDRLLMEVLLPHLPDWLREGRPETLEGLSRAWQRWLPDDLDEPEAPKKNERRIHGIVQWLDVIKTHASLDIYREQIRQLHRSLFDRFAAVERTMRGRLFIFWSALEERHPIAWSDEPTDSSVPLHAEKEPRVLSGWIFQDPVLLQRLCCPKPSPHWQDSSERIEFLHVDDLNPCLTHPTVREAWKHLTPTLKHEFVMSVLELGLKQMQALRHMKDVMHLPVASLMSRGRQEKTWSYALEEWIRLMNTLKDVFNPHPLSSAPGLNLSPEETWSPEHRQRMKALLDQMMAYENRFLALQQHAVKHEIGVSSSLANLWPQEDRPRRSGFMGFLFDVSGQDVCAFPSSTLEFLGPTFVARGLEVSWSEQLKDEELPHPSRRRF